MDDRTGKRLLKLRERVEASFDAGDWEELEILTGLSRIISGHSRLLRSLSWGDQDYSGNVLSVIRMMAEEDSTALDQIEEYLDEKYPEESHYVSAKPKAIKITFSPNVFEVTDVRLESDLVAVMMPFDAGFTRIYKSIRSACKSADFRCLRADDIWEESAIIQDVFNLILRSRVVIVDFTGKNPNVLYETGIAHTLGKLVVPISQSHDDVPFDLSHHRVLKYLPNSEGRAALRSSIEKKLGSVD